MATPFSPTQGELALVNQIFTKHDPQKFGIITGDVAVRIFGGANLGANVLGQIWGIADADNQGFLTRKGISVAVRLVGWAQKGETVSADLVNKPGPLAHINGFSSSPEPRRAVSPSPKSPTSSRFPPPLNAQDKAKFTRYFNSSNPVNGLLSGEKAREVFVKSKLPVDKLSQIWNLSDTRNRGSLDVSDFIVAMYLIQASMSGQLPFIPTTLPPGLYELASDQPLPGNAVVLHTTGNSGSFSPGLSSGFPPNSGPAAVQSQLTGKPLQPQYSGQPLPRQITGQGPARNTPALGPFSAASAVQPQPAWDVTPTEKATADKHFDGLDKQKRGYVESDVVVPFMLQSKLPESDLASIWDLADLNNDGHLTRDGFAVAFHLIQGRINGNEIPATLSASLMPPSMRAAAVPTSSPFQQPPSESWNDLMWDDSPAASHPQSTILQPQRTGQPTQSSAISAPPIATSQTRIPGSFASNKGLLDDDDDVGIGASSATINDHSAEIGNLQNQLQSTTRSLENTTKERSNVESAVQTQEAQLSALQTQLSAAKAAYGAESRLLATLRERFSNQSSEIQKAKEELIRSESDLSAVRLEKAEVEQGLLRDKEEVRELQRRMTETGSTIEVTKGEIEKAKKEAKQQKGLLAIAKKQLATREAERAKVAEELQKATAEAEEATKEREIAEAELAREPTVVNAANGHPFAPSPSLSAEDVTFPAAQPLPGTPGSPNSISGGSISAKSNNPFERLAAGSGSQSPFLPFADTSVSAPAAVTPTQNEGTTTDSLTFDQVFGEEEKPGPDVQEPSTEPERNGQPITEKVVSEPRIGTNEEVSEPSSDHDLFMTPPTSALDTLGTSANTLITEPDVKNLSPHSAPSAAQSTDRPLEAHTDIGTQLKELDVNESDSSDDDSEDETPLATLVGRAPPDSNRDEARKEAPVSNGHALPQTTAETIFSPVTTVVAATTEVQSTNPFPPPAKDSSPFATSMSPFASSSESPKVATVSDFDKAFGDLPNTAPAAAGKNLSFDNAFEDQFDFAQADTTTSLPTEGASSPFRTAFPPPPSSSSGIVKPLTTTVRDTGFENTFSPQQSAAGPARPVPTPTVDGLPVLPPVLETKPFSFEEAFTSNLLTPSAPAAAATSQVTPSQPPSNTDAASPSLGDAFDPEPTQRGSALGTVSSRTSSIPQVSQSPVSAFAPGSPPLEATSPRDTVTFPPSLPSGASPPRRVSSPKGRPPKDGGKEQVRHSKLSIRLPFRKKKGTQDSLPPSHHLAPITDESRGAGTPSVDDDVEPVKQLCSMGFSRTQAVAALEASSYDFQKALNSLLSTG